jgi:hypothetical protein
LILIVGHRGILGSALERHGRTTRYERRLGENHHITDAYTSAILCAGTKGFHECDGNDGVFRDDVDGNISLIRALLKNQVFVVFISTEAVERIGHRAAYSSNRLLVEQYLWGQENNAIVRPGRFDKSNVDDLAIFCLRIAQSKQQGIHRWP